MGNYLATLALWAGDRARDRDNNKTATRVVFRFMDFSKAFTASQTFALFSPGKIKEL
jgi:hypothetical protein